jgi:hypothetical protein
MKNAVHFDADACRSLAVYLYQLTTLGAAYVVEDDNVRGGWLVTITGF